MSKELQLDRLKGKLTNLSLMSKKFDIKLFLLKKQFFHLNFQQNKCTIKLNLGTPKNFVFEVK